MKRSIWWKITWKFRCWWHDKKAMWRYRKAKKTNDKFKLMVNNV